ncbi:MAG TPA: bifunctional ADP-heptose synthase [Candidatus Obscuribacterales bacterium]
MTNPLGTPGKDDQAEKQSKAPEQQPESKPGLSFDDVMSKQAAASQDAVRKEIVPKDVSPAIRRDISAVPRAQFTYQFGQRPPFQIRKSEFLHDIEKPVAEVKPLVDKFLKETPAREDESLTPAERNELTQTRDSLSRFTNAADALNKALHLARLYQHLRYIEEAKKATDLSLGIDPDNHLGKELFKELERLHPPDISIASRPALAPAPLSKANLRKRIAAMTGGKVMVVGDLLIDELLEGRPERISREAPVLILEHVDTELIPGGAANTANNVAALGGVCHAVGVCGKDDYAAKLANLLERHNITHSLVQDPSRPTTVKTRILSKAHALRQQLLRLDRISHEPIDALVEGLLVDRINQAGGQYKAIVLSDYRGGAVSDGVIRACKALAARENLMVVVDAQDHFERFQDVTLMTPNQPDTEKMVGFKITDRDSLKKAGDELLLLTGARAILVTRGPHGMVLFQPGEEMMELPAFNKSEVFDVTGAGDTVVAAMAPALVSGASYLEAMALGNLAASIVVRKPGTAVTNQKEMLEHLERVDLPD